MPLGLPPRPQEWWEPCRDAPVHVFGPIPSQAARATSRALQKHHSHCRSDVGKRKILLYFKRNDSSWDGKV